MATHNGKSLEFWIWDAACSIRGAQEASKYKDFILPLVFAKRLCDVFDDEVERIAARVGSRAKAFDLVASDKELVRFYLPFVPAPPEEPVWSAIRKLSDRIGEHLTGYLREIARANPPLRGIIDRIDFNATTHGQRDIDDDRLSNLIEKISEKRLGLDDVEADIIGRSYEYLIRKFAEGSGQSAGEFYTPAEVGMLMARIMDAQPGMTIYDPCCGSAGLLIKCDLAMKQKSNGSNDKKTKQAPLRLFGQEYIANTWAMANMNMIIHDMEGEIQIGDTFKTPGFRAKQRLKTFDRVVSNPMWNQNWFSEQDYDNDELGRFPQGAGFPGKQSADWGWVQHIAASLNAGGRAVTVLDTGAASRGSGNAGKNKEKEVRKWFVENDLIEGVIYLPENLFYNTSAPGILLLVIECKNADKAEAIALGVDQMRRYQRETPELFVPQMLFAVADAIGFAYGSTWNTARRSILNWKEETLGGLEAKVRSFCNRRQVLALLGRFIVFAEKNEALEKYILAQHQSTAADKVVARCLDATRGRGLIWHTQGSGKTFTMLKAAEMLFKAPQSEKPDNTAGDRPQRAGKSDAQKPGSAGAWQRGACQPHKEAGQAA